MIKKSGKIATISLKFIYVWYSALKVQIEKSKTNQVFCLKALKNNSVFLRNGFDLIFLFKVYPIA